MGKPSRFLMKWEAQNFYKGIAVTGKGCRNAMRGMMFVHRHAFDKLC